MKNNIDIDTALCIVITFTFTIVSTKLIIDAIIDKEDLTFIIISILATLLTIYYFISSLISMIKKKK
jgi:uncharacterized membrane protein|nr:MAG TPA: hypothetical protein [Caudoviricetes sp.]